MKIQDKEAKILIVMLFESTFISSHVWFNTSLFLKTYFDVGCLYDPTRREKQLRALLFDMQSKGLIKIQKAPNRKGRARLKASISEALQQKIKSLDTDFIEDMLLSYQKQNLDLLQEIIKGIASEL